MTIRNIPDDVQRRFRAQAAAKGQSMEAEARRLVIAAVDALEAAPRKSIGQILYEASRPGVDLPIPPRSPARVPDFE